MVQGPRRPGVRRRVPRPRRGRLRRPDAPAPAHPDRPRGRPTDRLARADARSWAPAPLPIGSLLHQLVDPLPEHLWQAAPARSEDHGPRGRWPPPVPLHCARTLPRADEDMERRRQHAALAGAPHANDHMLGGRGVRGGEPADRAGEPRRRQRSVERREQNHADHHAGTRFRAGQCIDRERWVRRIMCAGPANEGHRAAHRHHRHHRQERSSACMDREGVRRIRG